MEVTFNGRQITIQETGNIIFEEFVRRAIKNTPSSNIDKCFANAYTKLLTLRLGKQSEGQPKNTNAGIATGRLLKSIEIKKLGNKAFKLNETTIRISISQEEKFLPHGFYVGADELPASGFNTIAVLKMTQWVKSKKASFDFSNIKGRDKERGLAKAILWSFKKGGNRKILPKWYNVFKDGDKEVLKYIFEEKNCLEKEIKKILING